jgi:hypothetical protein
MNYARTEWQALLRMFLGQLVLLVLLVPLALLEQQDLLVLRVLFLTSLSLQDQCLQCHLQQYKL